MAEKNIALTALNFVGKPLQVLELARASHIELAISNAIITEVSRILRHKFYWQPEDVSDAVERILRFTRYLHVDYSHDVVPTDPDDNRVLECAVQARSDTVVTGDTDLLVMGSFQGISIQAFGLLSGVSRTGDVARSQGPHEDSRRSQWTAVADLGHEGPRSADRSLLDRGLHKGSSPRDGTVSVVVARVPTPARSDTDRRSGAISHMTTIQLTGSAFNPALLNAVASSRGGSSRDALRHATPLTACGGYTHQLLEAAGYFRAERRRRRNSGSQIQRYIGPLFAPGGHHAVASTYNLGGRRDGQQTCTITGLRRADVRVAPSDER